MELESDMEDYELFHAPQQNYVIIRGINNSAIFLFGGEKFSALKNFCVFNFCHCRPPTKYFNDENSQIYSGILV